MKLEITTPEQIYFSGEVTSVTLPGTNGLFTVWENHAPLISSLTKGKISYMVEKIEQELDIDGGFAEVSKNIVTVCLELV
ncbi:MAG: F0F1 ATP synthase subunit epsilon [Bacteroidota bacterium]|nr:F0F1 ATP synthase subunit epsilon [Bacteroidota bacterium]